MKIAVKNRFPELSLTKTTRILFTSICLCCDICLQHVGTQLPQTPTSTFLFLSANLLNFSILTSTTIQKLELVQDEYRKRWRKESGSWQDARRSTYKWCFDRWCQEATGVQKILLYFLNQVILKLGHSASWRLGISFKHTRESTSSLL